MDKKRRQEEEDELQRMKAKQREKVRPNLDCTTDAQFMKSESFFAISVFDVWQITTTAWYVFYRQIHRIYF